MDYMKTKRILDENQSFDWIKWIRQYQLVNMDWLTDIKLFDSMI